ncbi:MAG: hypothetical protein Q4G04_02870 [bacterium]|nr:hypothetical protein [bacterium]
MKNYLDISKEEIIFILKQTNKCILALSNNHQPYLIPMYYQLYLEEDKIIIKMKNENKGKKLEYLKNNSLVSLIFEYGNWGKINTITANGEAKLEEDLIIIKVNDISGRQYYR